MKDSTWLFIISTLFLVLSVIIRLGGENGVQYWAGFGMWGLFLVVSYIVRHLEKIETALEAKRD